MSSSTLTSLAMLKIHMDQGGDYLDYLKPFILQTLVTHKPQDVTDSSVKNYIKDDFGLEIPERTIQIVLKRIAKHHSFTKKAGCYHNIPDMLPNPGIFAEESNARRHIQAVLSGLVEFSRNMPNPLTNDNAEKALHKFLAEFDVPCLRAYLYDTVIPNTTENRNTNVVLVSNYFLHIQKSDPERFESFMIIVKGHMLANALLCPDLQDAPRSYKGVTFYFDTPLLVKWLDLEGEQKKNAADELITLLQNLNATIAIFGHTRDELDLVLKGSAEYINSPDGRGPIVMESRRSGRTKSDILLLAEQIDGTLESAGIKIKRSPPYEEKFQIDEKEFEKALEDEKIYYNNPNAVKNDINSVRSIYVLRKGTEPRVLEKSVAVLVTSNTAFARAAFNFGKKAHNISSVITDFSLANIAWLKAPVGAQNLPYTRAISFAYAAQQPSRVFWEHYLREIEKLENQGKITARDHQLLRSSPAVKELMYMTLGDEQALTEETTMETLQRVTSGIEKEVEGKYKKKEKIYRQTKEQLDLARETNNELLQRLYWKCDKSSKILSWSATILVVCILITGVLARWGLHTHSPIFANVISAGSTISILLLFFNSIVGVTVNKAHQRVQDHCRAWLLRRESKAVGLDLNLLDSGK